MSLGERETDVLVVGGGLGGVAAALAALRLGSRVILTEETDWLGGQLTVQATPPDEHQWIEQRGATRNYRRLREGIRDYYRRNYPLRPEARTDPSLNPGAGNVSPVCHEPKVGVAVLEEMLAPYLAGGRLQVWRQHRPVAAECDGDVIRAVSFTDDRAGDSVTVHAPYVLDATELGDLLELAGVEHVTGSESQDETGEAHALPGAAQPLDQQAISWCFALDYRPGEDHTIDKPDDYTFWRSYQASFWPAPQLGWVDCNPHTLAARERAIFHRSAAAGGQGAGSDFWHYRRIFARDQYPAGTYESDITLVNWPQIDYWLGPIVGPGEQERQQNLRAARQLSLSMLYWMQTEAPRYDGGTGYPELRIRPDVVDTPDGLAKGVYIRESRRIAAEFTILEQHVGVEARPEASEAEQFEDSVGIGSYRIDLHPSTGLRNYVDISSYPYQIPLGSLIPVRIDNMLPANKNIGTTHITNGCYRLHPTEWAIGEVAGALAGHCLATKQTPRQVRNTDTSLRDFQQLLSDTFDASLAWPREVRRTPR